MMKKVMVLAVAAVFVLASIPALAVDLLPYTIADWAMNEGTPGTAVGVGQVLDSAAPNSNNIAPQYVDSLVNPMWASTGSQGDGIGVAFDGVADHLNFGWGANGEINNTNTRFQYYMRWKASSAQTSNTDFVLWGRAAYFAGTEDVFRISGFQADWYGVKNYGLAVGVMAEDGTTGEINMVDAAKRLNSDVWFEMIFDYDADSVMAMYIREEGTADFVLWGWANAVGPLNIGETYHSGLSLGSANPGGHYDKRNFTGIIESAAIYGIPEPSMLLIGAAALLAWRKK